MEDRIRSNADDLAISDGLHGRRVEGRSVHDLAALLWVANRGGSDWPGGPGRQERQGSRIHVPIKPVYTLEQARAVNTFIAEYVAQRRPRR